MTDTDIHSHVFVAWRTRERCDLGAMPGLTIELGQCCIEICRDLLFQNNQCILYYLTRTLIGVISSSAVACFSINGLLVGEIFFLALLSEHQRALDAAANARFV